MLYFESENELKFYNLEARPDKMFNVCIHNKGADKNVRYPG